MVGGGKCGRAVVGGETHHVPRGGARDAPYLSFSSSATRVLHAIHTPLLSHGNGNCCCCAISLREEMKIEERERERERARVLLVPKAVGACLLYGSVVVREKR